MKILLFLFAIQQLQMNPPNFSLNITMPHLYTTPKEDTYLVRSNILSGMRVVCYIKE